MARAPRDEELLALLDRVEAPEALLGEAEEDAPVDAPADEPCTHCGEPSIDLDACAACAACGEDGCLPRDDWSPGESDPCLTRCARCGRYVHVDCAGLDAAGNRVCCGPREPDDEIEFA